MKSVFKTVMHFCVLLSIVAIVLWARYPTQFADLVALTDILIRHSGTVFNLTCSVVNFMLWICGPSWQTILCMLIMSVLLVWQLVSILACVYKFVKNFLIFMLIAFAVFYMYNRDPISV